MSFQSVVCDIDFDSCDIFPVFLAPMGACLITDDMLFHIVPPLLVSWRYLLDMPDDYLG